MKTKIIPSIKFINPGTNAFAIETKPEHIKLHTITLACGKRGSGKSFFISNLLNWLDFDIITLVSPTADSNYSQFKHLNIQKEHIFEPEDPDVVQKITDIVDNERDLLVDYRQKIQILKELKELYKRPNNLNNENTQLFSEYIDPITQKWITPIHRFNGRHPKIACFVDDAQGSRIFQNRKFLNLALKHRHCGSFQNSDEASIGLSLFIAIQSYTSQSSSLPRAIRNNCTHFALFRSKNEKELKLIAEEFSGEVSPDTFMKIYDYVMQDVNPHSMLFIDLHKKKEHPSMFRKNYNEFIILDQDDEIKL